MKFISKVTKFQIQFFQSMKQYNWFEILTICVNFINELKNLFYYVPEKITTVLFTMTVRKYFKNTTERIF